MLGVSKIAHRVLTIKCDRTLHEFPVTITLKEAKSFQIAHLSTPAKDIFHSTVRLALEKDGWVITDDPLHLKVGGTEMYIDLAAERLIAAQKDGQKIAVEIKSFLRESELTEFHLALGQFLNYRLALKQKLPNFVLYLAIPTDTYNTLFRRPFIQDAIEEYQLRLLIFDPKKQEILAWRP